MYKNINVNRQVTFQDSILDGCYIVINDVHIQSLKSLSAFYEYKIYKSKDIFTLNNLWNIEIIEIKCIKVQFTPNFIQGDLFEKISNELILAIIRDNPTWKESDFEIEK